MIIEPERVDGDSRETSSVSVSMAEDVTILLGLTEGDGM